MSHMAADGTSTGTVVVIGPAGTRVEVAADNLGELEGAIAATARVLRRHEVVPLPLDPEFPPL